MTKTKPKGFPPIGGNGKRGRWPRQFTNCLLAYHRNLRNEHLHGVWHDLDGEGGAPDKIDSIGFDIEVPVVVERDFFGNEWVRRFVFGQATSKEQFQCRRNLLQPQFADSGDVKQPVGGRGIGYLFEAAARVATVADGYGENGAVHLFVAAGQAHVVRFQFEECDEHRQRIDPAAAAENLFYLVGNPHHHAIEAPARAVDKVACVFLSVRVGVGYFADVDGRAVAVKKLACQLAVVACDAPVARPVVAGAIGNECKYNSLFISDMRSVNAVHYLVECAVAAHHEQVAKTRFDHVARYLDGVSGKGGQLLRKVNFGPLQQVVDALPILFQLAFARIGVHYHAPAFVA